MNESATNKQLVTTRRIVAAFGITGLLLAAMVTMALGASSADASKPSILAENERAHMKIVAAETITGTVQPTGTPVPQATGTVSKVSICHRTGSLTNPYVMITVSMNALPAHQQHGDLYPAPQGGCPAGTPRAQHTPRATSTPHPTAAPHTNKGNSNTGVKPKTKVNNDNTSKGNSPSAANKGTGKEQEKQDISKAKGNSGKNNKP